MFRSLTLVAVILTFAAVGSAQSKAGSWLSGTWTGTGYQIDANETWTMKVTVKGKKYTIEYPSLNCSGRWLLISFGSRLAKLRERITNGVDKCIDRGTVTIQRLNRRQIEFRYQNHKQTLFSASGILNREQ